MLFVPPSPSSVLAFATTIHLSLALLRNHRRHAAGSMNPIALVSFSLAALPWIFPSLLGLCAGLGVHIAWFVTCERRLAPALAPATITPQSFASTAARKAVHAATAPAVQRSGAARASSEARPRGFVPAPVIAAFDETPDIKTIRILRPEGFDYEPGQFLAVRIRVDGKEYVRCYSISSAPNVQGYLEISVKRIGTVSNALHATARPGAMLSVKAPAGALRYPSGDDRPIVLLAGGIGITPLMSMLRHAIATEPTRPVTLIYSAQTPAAMAFHDELEWVARRHPHVRVYFASSKGARAPHIYRGHIDEQLLRTAVPELAHSISFICGPEPMLESLRSLLTRIGVPPAQIRFEVFRAAMAVAAGVEPDAVPATAAATDRKTPLTSHAMRCTRTGTEVPLQPGQTLLEAAEHAGVAVPSLCRAGVCGTCRLQVTSGNVHCESTMLGDDEQRDGFVLACVTTANSDCSVEV